MILSSLKTKDMSESAINHDLESFKRSTRQSSTGTFGKTKEKLHLLLEYFVEDSDKCIYFPEERLINKMKLDKSLVIDCIENTVKDLKKQHNEKRRNHADYLTTPKFNTIVGSIVTEMNDGLIKLIPISYNPLDESKSIENTDVAIIFNHIKSKYDEISKRDVNLDKILATNIHDVVLENLKEIQNKRKEIFPKDWSDKLIMELIGGFKRSITDPYYILTLKAGHLINGFLNPLLCV